MKNVHTNLASGYRYHGGNSLILDRAARKNRWKECEWATRAQAEKLGRPLLPNQKGVVVMLNEKQFTVFNAAQLTEAPQTMQEVADEENMGNYMDAQRRWNNSGQGFGLEYEEAVQMALGEL